MFIALAGVTEINNSLVKDFNIDYLTSIGTSSCFAQQQALRDLENATRARLLLAEGVISSTLPPIRVTRAATQRPALAREGAREAVRREKHTRYRNSESARNGSRSRRPKGRRSWYAEGAIQEALR